MIEISLKIEGNQEDRSGNPLPKLRMTGKQGWRPEARRYGRWKLFVQDALVTALYARSPEASREAAKNIATLGKPLVLGDRKARMDIKIQWKNGSHGDPENIFGSIADALFYNDKHLAGSFDYEYSSERKGSVEILISISEQRTCNTQQRSTRTTLQKKSSTASKRSA